LGLALDEPKDKEITTQVEGLDFLIAEEVKPFADKSRVDYTSGPYGEGFTIRVVGGASC
jgi:hypothetical protein